jgi:outer membrane protein OmpA-like peptidoglycan-associated protein
MKLSEARAVTVRDWLAAHDFVPAATPVKAYGETGLWRDEARRTQRDAGRQG